VEPVPAQGGGSHAHNKKEKISWPKSKAVKSERRLLSAGNAVVSLV
jgi:hypothetical protein